MDESHMGSAPAKWQEGQGAGDAGGGSAKGPSPAARERGWGWASASAHYCHADHLKKAIMLLKKVWYGY